MPSVYNFKFLVKVEPNENKNYTKQILYFKLIKLKFNRKHTEADVPQYMFLDIAVLQNSKILEKCVGKSSFLIKVQARRILICIFTFF